MQRRENAETQKGDWGSCGTYAMINFAVLVGKSHDHLTKLGTCERHLPLACSHISSIHYTYA